jgi:cell division protein FtsN
VATKDYVKRGRSPKPVKKSSPSRKAPVPSGFPIKWAITAIILVIGLIAGLFFLAGTNVPKPAIPQDDIVEIIKPKSGKSVEKPANNKNTIPPKPEEKWRYIHELENKKVSVVDLSGNTRTSAAKAEKAKAEKAKAEKAKAEKVPVRYLLQCGAYRNKSQADERKATIAFQGLNSQIKMTKDAKGTWYRVVLGPYSQKNKAEMDQTKLQNNGVSPCAIWHWK